MAGLSEISALTGWRRFAVAAGFGGLSALAFAPLRFWPLLAIGLSGLALLLEGSLSQAKPKWSAFVTGLAFGTLYFALSMFWLANAFLVQADAFGWMIPIVLPLFFAFLGLFFAGASVVHVWIRQRVPLDGPAALLPLVIGLAGFEWLRGHILTGLPWNLFAQSVAGSTLLLQPLAAIGPYGYGLVLLILYLSPAAAMLHPAQARRVGLGAGALASVIVGFGAIRLALLPPTLRDDVRTVIVQPNVAQRDKLDAQKRVQALRRSLEMTVRAASEAPSGVTQYAVWPENAYPLLSRIPDFSPILSEQMPPESYLVSGTIRSVEEGYTNGLEVYGPAGAGAPMVATYDKHHLVPFGETLPFYGALKALGLATLSPVGDGGFIPGQGPTRLELGPAPFAPLICYEDIFPGELYPRGERPEWLTVVTNDAWFGDNAGPMQHLDIARMRAVETGLPVARSANTGISALIDAEGRILHSLPLYEPGVITAKLPVARPPTLYSRSGDLIFFATLSFITLMVVRGTLQGRIAKGNLGEPQGSKTRGKEIRSAGEQARTTPD
ncbi:apolipoprotein N-acyltransferase [Parvularcula lutaonensis]|nr:apolipoprotein N-acyltransferase [Parvularcula lutaonensis]